MIEKILTYLPGIDEDSLTEMLNVIEQSNKFGNHFNTTHPDNEFELGYARYLIDHNTEFLDHYKSIVEKACFAEFLEWYEYIAKNILRQDVQDILGIHFAADNLDWETTFKTSELLGWAYRISDYRIFLDNIDKVHRLGNIMKEFFNERSRPLSTLDEDYFQADHAQLVLDSIEHIIINNNTKSLTDQLNTNEVVCMIEVYGWDNSFNPILLNWICSNRNRIQLWSRGV